MRAGEKAAIIIVPHLVVPLSGVTTLLYVAAKGIMQMYSFFKSHYVHKNTGFSIPIQTRMW